MLRTLFITLLSALFCGATYASEAQKFTLAGQIDGLKTGDTLRFERVAQPCWTLEQAFDVIVAKPNVFSYKGTQKHDQEYLMTYLPKAGKIKHCDRRGKPLIVTAGDRITFTGTADDIYYSALGGGIYDEPMLAGMLVIEDSVGRVRGSYLRKAQEAWERKDTVTNQEWSNKFNTFSQNNPGIDRMRALDKAYTAANPQGTLYMLIDRIPSLSYTPIAEARAAYEPFSPELKASYYGQLYARQVDAMERLAPGQPAPDFALMTVDGKTITRDDFKGQYLMFYHWGMCPGSIQIDQHVQGLHAEYKEKGFQVVGLTESIATIRQIYEGLPAGQKTPTPGTDDIRPVLEKMLEHPWIEVEFETDQPDNKSIMQSFEFSGWPFFVLIGPDGQILARGYPEAFWEAVAILNRELGDEKRE